MSDERKKQIESIQKTSDRIAELEAKLAAAKKRARRWKRNSSLNLHRVLTCGVAARHPDENLTLTGAYFDKWNSQQAQEVRELRKDRDTLRAENATLREALKSAPDQAHCRLAIVRQRCEQQERLTTLHRDSFDQGFVCGIFEVEKILIAALDAGVQP